MPKPRRSALVARLPNEARHTAPHPAAGVGSAAVLAGVALRAPCPEALCNAQEPTCCLIKRR
eukprot:8580282-Alexandrium_andersonii.AAC.1